MMTMMVEGVAVRYPSNRTSSARRGAERGGGEREERHGNEKGSVGMLHTYKERSAVKTTACGIFSCPSLATACRSASVSHVEAAFLSSAFCEAVAAPALTATVVRDRPNPGASGRKRRPPYAFTSVRLRGRCTHHRAQRETCTILRRKRRRVNQPHVSAMYLLPAGALAGKRTSCCA